MKNYLALFTVIATLLIFLLTGTLGLNALPEKETKETEQSPVLPPELVDLEGQTIDLLKLAQKKRLFFVTLKATWCAVCANQLIRLAKLKTRLNNCGATFVVLAPGPRKELKAIKKRTGFHYPFVEDKDLKLDSRLDLE